MRTAHDIQVEIDLLHNARERDAREQMARNELRQKRLNELEKELQLTTYATDAKVRLSALTEQFLSGKAVLTKADYLYPTPQCAEWSFVFLGSDHMKYELKCTQSTEFPEEPI